LKPLLIEKTKISMDQRIHNSEHVGGVLLSAVRAIRTANAGKRAASVSAPIHTVERNPNRLPIRVALKRRKLIARGSGVYEEEKNGDIWFRDGDYLVRQAIDVNDVVEKYLESCQGS
jgi:hypothetical protein